MEITPPSAAASVLAARIREARDDLTRRWLDRIAARPGIEPDRVFPTDQMLEHAPVLLDGIADYLEDPADGISADVPVVAVAMKLGELRSAQGFEAAEILKEYEILGSVLFAFASDVVAGEGDPGDGDGLLVCGHRIYRAVSFIEQVTTAYYLRVLGERVGEREERLRRFSRLITHELKNRVGATLGAGQLLQEEWLGDDERRRFAGMVEENAIEIQKVLENLVALTKVDKERRRQRNIRLDEAVSDVFRQVRQLARGRGVELRLAGDLPAVEVNAAAVELCLLNYLSNSIKYSDPARPDRWAEVSAEVSESGEGGERFELVVRVRDNGLGVPAGKRTRMFERFFRAHEGITQVEGTGLGLNLVQETAERLGGRAWAELEQATGAVFGIAFPCRRTDGGGFSCVAGVNEDEARNPGDAAPATGFD
ncbi:hypothetical protein BH23GEM9_BH23GEM9_11540 [soil metagenome]